MERIALLSDIHGNMPALEAVLADIDRRGIARLFCLGDLVGKGPHSERAVDICRERCERVIRGNWDNGFAMKPTETAMQGWHKERLGPERLAYLRDLPNTIDFVMSGQHVRLVHASPQGVYHRVHQRDPVDVLETMFESTGFTGYGFNPNVVGYGDIHDAFLRSLGPRTLFNVGSVGNPLDQTRACYAILDGSSNGPANGPANGTADGTADDAPLSITLGGCRTTSNGPSGRPPTRACRTWRRTPTSCAPRAIGDCRRCRDQGSAR